MPPSAPRDVASNTQMPRDVEVDDSVVDAICPTGPVLRKGRVVFLPGAFLSQPALPILPGCPARPAHMGGSPRPSLGQQLSSALGIMLRSSAGVRTLLVAYKAPEKAASRGTRNIPPAGPPQQQVVELSLSQVESALLANNTPQLYGCSRQ